MQTKHLLAAALLLSGAAHADTITQWNFNSVSADADTATGSTTASVGSGSASLIGGVTGGFGSGASNGGSSDPVVSDDTGWQTTGYAAQGSGDATAGAEFLVSTVGYENIIVSYDLRHSNTSSRFELVQYTLDGSTWQNFSVLDGNAGDTWFNGRTVDLSSIDGADNNALFGFRVVATYAPATSSYTASKSSSSYSTTGTWRFDMVGVSGAALPVPEGDGLVLAMSGLLGLAAMARRNKR